MPEFISEQLEQISFLSGTEADFPMPIKTKAVATVLSTDAAGNVVDSLPVREVIGPTLDAAGRMVSPIDTENDAVFGYPIRFVAGLTTTNSAGQTVPVVPVKSAAWTPSALGASLLDMWDAEEEAKFTLVGSAVSAWFSSKNAYSAAQGTGAARPARSATSFNGRAGVTFDGADDALIYAGQPFPNLSSPSEIWALLDVTSPGATAGSKYAFSYGGLDNASARALRRSSVAGVNRGATVVSAVSGVEHPTGVGGRHVWRGVIEATQFRVDIDGVAGAYTAGAPGTGTTRVVLGALQTGISTFFQGVASMFAITAPLTDAEALAFTNYLKTRGGIA